MIFYSILRINRIERKFINISYEEVQILIEHLKEMLIEAERVAEKLELEIKEKEDMLADLSELLELKLIRMEELVSNSIEDKNIKNTVREMSNRNIEVVDIAKRLGISSAEVDLMLKLDKEDFK
jgi:hypothetical protein